MKISLIVISIIGFLSSCATLPDFSKQKYLSLRELKPDQEEAKLDILDDQSTVNLTTDCDTITLKSGKIVTCTITSSVGNKITFSECPSSEKVFSVEKNVVHSFTEKGVFYLLNPPKLETISSQLNYDNQDSTKNDLLLSSPFSRAGNQIDCDTLILKSGELLICTINEVQAHTVIYSTCPKSEQSDWIQKSEIKLSLEDSLIYYHYRDSLESAANSDYIMDKSLTKKRTGGALIITAPIGGAIAYILGWSTETVTVGYLLGVAITETHFIKPTILYTLACLVVSFGIIAIGLWLLSSSKSDVD